MYEMRGLEHGVELLPGLSPLISGLVYLNRSLDSSQTANPSEDEEARESEVLKSLRIHVQLAKDNGGLSLSLSLSLSLLGKIRDRQRSRERSRKKIARDTARFSAILSVHSLCLLACERY